MIATSTFQTFLQQQMVDTQWAQIKVWKTRTKLIEGKTASIQAIVRVPVCKSEKILKPSGFKEIVFAREFIDPALARTYKYTNLWMQTDKYAEAKVKYSTIPDDKVYGMVWSPRGFGVRVKMEDAVTIAPILTGKSFIVGERYVVAGVPQDVTPQQLFEALASCDVPWEDIEQAQKISMKYRGGSCSWIIKASRPPPTNLFFLDECVISVDKESIRAKPQQKVEPRVTASGWQKSVTCPTQEDAQMEQPPMKLQKQRAAGGEVNETPPPARSNVQLPAENQTGLGTFIGEPFPGSQQNNNDIMEMTDRFRHFQNSCRR